MIILYSKYRFLLTLCPLLLLQRMKQMHMYVCMHSHAHSFLFKGFSFGRRPRILLKVLDHEGSRWVALTWLLSSVLRWSRSDTEGSIPLQGAGGLQQSILYFTFFQSSMVLCTLQEIDYCWLVYTVWQS